MALRFNPPPGWPPPPEDWLPPKGWKPDPSFPRAPAGWVFVVDDAARIAPSLDPIPGITRARRRRLLAPTLTGVVGLVVGLLMGGALGSTASRDDGEAEAIASAAPDDVDDATNDGTGTRANPYPAGSTIELEDWTVVLGTTVQDATDAILDDDALLDDDPINDSPALGRQFVMVPVTATYTGAETGLAWIDLEVDFVGSAGNTFGFDEDSYCGLIPDSLVDEGRLYPGATAEGNECRSVPSGQVAGGTWALSTGGGDEPVFVALE
ncbi:hypothetical protein [Cellulomonas composti]|uniref:DUF4352 domain-containing protein n=1 Tax=Cellulomonas composti TaxID=266130 RepID=A0A511J701_9CELL|nr:hypothetical protein [Cellulomonas composti]GEL93792.1 hypothetical protein CCO02nite_04500 [Cellulomonas composti]